MAFAVQNDQGTVADANAYIDVAFLESYWQDRGEDLSSSSTAAKEAAIVKATDHLDGRYQYVGYRLQSFQTTEWPRYDAWDADDRIVNGIPCVIKRACAELAFRALSAPLLPDPATDSTGARVQSIKKHVRGIEKAVTYVIGAAYQQPLYPAVSNMLHASGLVRIGNRLARA